MKRLLDVGLAALGLLLLGIPLVLLMWRVRYVLGSPVFFHQTRPGLRGRPFRMIKFRTMTDARSGVANCCRTKSDSGPSDASFARPVWMNYPNCGMSLRAK